jgi:hypothetical protein
LFFVGNVYAQTQSQLRPNSFAVDSGTKTATATAGAATLAKNAGVVTTESVSTAAGANYALTLTNTTIAAADQVYVSVANGTNSGGQAVVSTVAPAAGSVVITIRNVHATTAFNGTLKVSFLVVKN